jgi:hypothetical protein
MEKMMSEVGKNFSGNNSSGKRKKSDFYETPYSLTQQFLDATQWNKTATTLEPACGDGAIVKVLAKNNFTNITAYDVEVNFLTETNKYKQIITNPPFSLAKQFIFKAKEISEKFALLLPLSYLHGKQRFDAVYSDQEFPLDSVYVFTRYPMLGDELREDGKYNTGMMVYAWFLWDKDSKNPEPVIRWLDNQQFVKGKNE